MSHHLSLSLFVYFHFNTAWEAATEESDKLAVLDTGSNNLVKFMKSLAPFSIIYLLH